MLKVNNDTMDVDGEKPVCEGRSDDNCIGGTEMSDEV